MFAAFLTAFLFAASAVLATQSVRQIGSTQANFWRLLVALVFLAVYAHGWGGGLNSPVFWIFFLSGCVGFGLGDVALFYAFARIGSRLTILLTQCLAAPIAGLAEWWWLGVLPTPAQIFSGAIILTGVALALAPGQRLGLTRMIFWTGVLFGLGSALGQGLGAVISRKGYDLAEVSGFLLDGPTAAYHRILGGILVGGFFALLTRLYLQKSPASGASPQEQAPLRRRSSAWPWVVANGLAGPALGVSCFQWALSTTPSAVVLPIVALTPIIVMPMAWILEGDRPGPRVLLGSLIAVGGAAALAWTGT